MGRVAADTHDRPTGTGVVSARTRRPGELDHGDVAGIELQHGGARIEAPVRTPREFVAVAGQECATRSPGEAGELPERRVHPALAPCVPLAQVAVDDPGVVPLRVLPGDHERRQQCSAASGSKR